MLKATGSRQETDLISVDVPARGGNPALTQSEAAAEAAAVRGGPAEMAGRLKEAVRVARGQEPPGSVGEDPGRDARTSTRYILDEAIKSGAWRLASWQGFKLPGQGEPLATCEMWGLRGCLNAAEHPGGQVYVQSYQKRCCRASCPLCVEAWANRTAARATRRAAAYMAHTRKKLSHVVISPPGVMRGAPLSELKRGLRDIMRRTGISGAVIVLHPFRFEGKKATPVASPHFHLVASGWLEATGEAARATGWVTKKVRTLHNEGEVFGAIKYVLSHAGIRGRTHAITYTGQLHYSKLRLEPEEPEPTQCPYCPLQLEHLRLSPEAQDRPPPFDVGFVGLVSYGCLEAVDDFDFWVYGSGWAGGISSRQAAAERRAEREEAAAAAEWRAERARQKARGMAPLIRA